MVEKHFHCEQFRIFLPHTTHHLPPFLDKTEAADSQAQRRIGGIRWQGAEFHFYRACRFGREIPTNRLPSGMREFACADGLSVEEHFDMADFYGANV